MTETRRKPPPRRKKLPTRKSKPKSEWLREAQQDIERLADIKADQSRLSDEAGELQTRILVALDRAGQASTSFDGANGRRLQATRVQGSSVLLDEEKLKKRLGAALWNKVTTRALDRKKLEALIGSGEVKTSDVAACSDEKPKAPYIKITSK